MTRAKILFGCYRRGDANDPDQYVASVAAVLTLYEPGLIREVTDPRSGISTDEKFCAFMPNSGELKVYCDAIRDRRGRYERLGAIPRRPVVTLPLDRETPGRRANVFVGADTPKYADAVTAAATADPADWKLDENGRQGIWVSLNLLRLPAVPHLKPFSAPTDEVLRARYVQQ